MDAISLPLRIQVREAFRTTKKAKASEQANEQHIGNGVAALRGRG